MKTSKPEHCPESTKIFLAQYKSLERVRQFVAHQAEKCGYNENDLFGIKMAVDEAFTNIINHAYEGECIETVRCSCFENEKGFTVKMVDNGRSFDPERIPDPDLDSNLEERMMGGLGVHLMRSYMDEVHFSVIPQPEEGITHNQLVMVKRKNSS
ncbi:MAG: ATP-binding protein [Anaerolineales bacterium]|jgi:serine/threonine-protein kinase RsbW